MDAVINLPVDGEGRTTTDPGRVLLDVPREGLCLARAKYRSFSQRATSACRRPRMLAARCRYTPRSEASEDDSDGWRNACCDQAIAVFDSLLQHRR